MMVYQGCQALADALRVNRTLHSIDLENTRLSGPDCTVLADGLLCNDIVTAIRLDSNPLGDDTRLILRALQRKSNPVQYIRHACACKCAPLQLFSHRELSTINCAFDSEKSVVSFNAANTSGHYRLDLSSPADLKIAQVPPSTPVTNTVSEPLTRTDANPPPVSRRCCGTVQRRGLPQRKHRRSALCRQRQVRPAFHWHFRVRFCASRGCPSPAVGAFPRGICGV